MKTLFHEKEFSMDRYHKEYQFSLSSILSFVWRGLLVGCVAGTIASVFRLLIELSLKKVVHLYE